MSHVAISDARLEPMSLERWAALPEDEPGEIVDGYRVAEEVPENVHELVVAWLRVLGSWGVARGAIVLGSGAKFAIADFRPSGGEFRPGVGLYR